jgi:hypothetical protein
MVSQLLAIFIPEADSSGGHDVKRRPTDLNVTFAGDGDIKPDARPARI